MKKSIFFTIGIIFMLIFSACSSNLEKNNSLNGHIEHDEHSSIGTGNLEDREENIYRAQRGEDGVYEVAIDGYNFGYHPDIVLVPANENVRIVFTNVDGVHDLVIDELNVKTPIVNNGNSYTVEFSTSEAGSFEFYCSVGNHRAAGMFGTLIVE